MFLNSLKVNFKLKITVRNEFRVDTTRLACRQILTENKKREYVQIATGEARHVGPRLSNDYNPDTPVSGSI